MRLNPFPWVEIVDPKPEPTFTKDQVLEKMIEVYGDNLANPENYPSIARQQFKVAKYLCGLGAKNASAAHLTGDLV